MTAEIEKPIKLIATYSRVSTSNQEEQQTVQIQLNTLQEFAKKNNYTIVENYIDDGWSGDVLARPALDKLRQDAKSKIWEAVLIYDPDRLARRYSYQELVMDELREAGIEIIFITVSAPKNSEDKILHGVRGLFAEYERAKITERFRLGKLRKAKDGHILTTKPLYGYNYIPKQDKKHGYLEINPEEARVVRMIFSWVANDGMTLRGIVKKLQQLGIRPRESKRGVWSTSTLSTMLRHRAYIGEAHWGSSYAVVPEKPLKNERYKKIKKTSRKMRPRDEWIIIPVPVIIETELFEKAGRQLKANFALCQRNKKNEYLLAGKIECVCGRRRSGEGYYNKPNLYYRCSDRVLSFPLPPKCEEKGINARVADDLVWKKVAGLMSSPELLAEQVNRWFNSRQTKATSALVDSEALKREVGKLNEQLERYNKGYGAGVFTLEQLKGYTEPLREKISQLETQIANAANEASQTRLETPSKQEMAVFAEKAKETLQDLKFETKRAIILNTVERVIGTQSQLQVIGYIPLNVQLFTHHRHGANTIRHTINDNLEKTIPFTFTIKLPPPQYERMITARNSQGRILQSAPV
jgi:site-specific DNA recombinase